ncbi:YgaP family membrane protein [Methylolobus aquaticus]
MNLVKNVGKVDKTVRIAVGALLIVLAATGTIGVWGWIGLLPLATGFMGTCPAYTVMGISTTDTKA